MTKIVPKLKLRRFQPSHFGRKPPIFGEYFRPAFLLNILLVFETLPNQRKGMFSLFNQSFYHNSLLF